jgi:hypothetical protein
VDCMVQGAIEKPFNGSTCPPNAPKADICTGKACAHEPNSICGPGELCLAFNRINACAAACDPFAPVCPTGYICSGGVEYEWSDPSRIPQFGCVPDMPTFIAAEGKACGEYGGYCAEGMACLGKTKGEEPVCRKACDPAVPGMCGAGTCNELMGLDFANQPTSLGYFCELDPQDAGDPCNPTLTCGGNLPCLDDECSGRDRCVSPAGGDKEACYQDNTCDPGLACLPNQTPLLYCNPSGLYQCCRPTGGPYQPCGTGGTCDAGLSCTTFSPNYFSQCDISPCCLPSGDQKEACPCNPGFVCLNVGPSNSNYCGGLFECCLGSGDYGEPCNADGTCNGALTCKPGQYFPSGPCLYKNLICCQ